MSGSTVSPPEAAGAAFDISGFQYLFDYTSVLVGNGRTVSLSQEGIQTTYDRQTHRLTVSLDGSVEWEKSLVEHIQNLQPKMEEMELEIAAEDMVLFDETENLRVKLVVTRLQGSIAVESDEPRIYQLGFYLLVGEK